MGQQYRIVYTYFNRGFMEEEEMTLEGLSLPEALTYVRQMAYLFCYEDFAINKVYMAAAHTATRIVWLEVQDWAEIEHQAEWAKRNAETRKEEG